MNLTSGKASEYFVTIGLILRNSDFADLRNFFRAGKFPNRFSTDIDVPRGAPVPTTSVIKPLFSMIFVP